MTNDWAEESIGRKGGVVQLSHQYAPLANPSACGQLSTWVHGASPSWVDTHFPALLANKHLYCSISICKFQICRCSYPAGAALRSPWWIMNEECFLCLINGTVCWHTGKSKPFYVLASSEPTEFITMFDNEPLWSLPNCCVADVMSLLLEKAKWTSCLFYLQRLTWCKLFLEIWHIISRNFCFNFSFSLKRKLATINANWCGTLVHSNRVKAYCPSPIQN